MKKKYGVRRITLMGVLTAIALTIFILEAQIPPISSIPGIKLGLANIVTLFALAVLGPRDAFVILIIRVFLGSLFSGQIMTLAYSLTGGLMCLAAESLLIKTPLKKNLWAVSVIGAIIHNVAQICVAVVITATPGIFWYLPYLIIAGIITGAFTGACTQLTLKKGEKIIQKLL